MDATSNATTLLNFILESLGHIQLARDFENEFERYQLKLDVIQLRISRWGQISGFIHDSNKSIVPQSMYNAARKLPAAENISGLENIPKDSEEKAVETLSTIRDTLARAERRATSIKTRLTANDTQLLDPNTKIPYDLMGMGKHFLKILDNRRVQKNKVVDGVKWAFYKKESFDRIIADVSLLIDELEKLAPPAVTKKWWRFKRSR